MTIDLTADDRITLLRLARGSIESRLGGIVLAQASWQGRLAEPSGAFVTLKSRAGNELRGCVGYVEPLYALADVVSRAAVAAAFSDARFDPVGAHELPQLSIGISVLGRLQAIRPEAVEVGRHGLLIRCSSHSGLLLPQVAVEQGWGRESFLDHTCRKAGLPSGGWRRPEAEILAFTAVVFEEPG